MDERAFALANGIVYGVTMALLAWLGAIFHIGEGAIKETEQYYPGFKATPLGGLLGAFYGLATGLAMGWAVAWLYNRFAERRASENPEEIIVVEEIAQEVAE